MIKANLKKNIVELSGNEADHLNELMMLVWELKEKYPEQRELMKEAFNVFMDATERPVFENEDKKPAPLDEEDLEYLLRKITTIRDSDKGLSFVYYSDGNINVQIWHKDSPRAALRSSGEFYFRLHEQGADAEEARRIYDECTAYLEQLADK